MYHMKTVTVRDLRNDFRRVSKWIEKGETVQIVKRGKPFARLAPEPKSRSFVGSMLGTAVLPPDLEAPLGIEWDAMK
jgi:antitoxin (DNA-binding transcriptional repressor) of toxin-antitoxin stability system